MWNMDSVCWLWKRIQVFKTKCMRKLLRISYLEHKTNDWVRSKTSFLVGPQEPLLATIKRQKFAWFEHARRHNSLSKTILQGTLEGGRYCARQRKSWMDNIKEWTYMPAPELLTWVACRKDWKRTSAELSLVSLWQPSWPRGWFDLENFLSVLNIRTYVVCADKTRHMKPNQEAAICLFQASCDTWRCADKSRHM